MNLLDKIEKPSKHKGKLINLSEEDWNMLEAYRQYGSKKRGFEINLNKGNFPAQKFQQSHVNWQQCCGDKNAVEKSFVGPVAISQINLD